MTGELMAAQVTGITLSHQRNTTVARIDVNGQVRFTHQTEPAKDGKPDRVVVDILAATHKIGGKVFSELPICLVQQIRTSQFAVSPEKIVRIVFDVDVPPLYRIESDESSVYVYFTDKAVPAFSTWSSASVAKPAPKPKDKPTPVTVAAKQELKKTEPKAQPTLAQKPAVEASQPTPEKPVPTVKPKAKPKVSNNTNAEFAVTGTAPKQAVKPHPAVANKAPAKTETKPVTVAKKSTSDAKPAVTAKPKAQKPAAEVKKPKAASSAGQQTLAGNMAAEKPKAVSKPVAQKKADTKAKPVAQQKTDTKRSTSRFRRTPSQMKIKGTMVAEFPKRLVIKYKANKHRDPFETLINPAKSHNSPIEKRVPNVEGIRLVGILESDGATNRALFEDTEGYGYILKSGDKVRNGYVLRVENDRVYFQIFEYGWSRTVAMKIDDY
jgi:hypothetical protein